MQTNPQDYNELLYLIQDKNLPTRAVLLPKDEEIYYIDLNKRKIFGPKVLSVEKDHQAEIIYFKINRYYDNMDLANTVGVVQYVNKNAKDDGHIWAIPYYDTFTCGELNPEEKDMMLFPWVIEGPATAAPGPVEFAVKFYCAEEFDNEKTGEKDYKFTFILNTQPAVGEVLYGMNVISDDNENTNIYDTTELEQIYNRLKKLEDLSVNKLYWIEA